MTVLTGDVLHAGTDTQIYVTVFGIYGTSEEMVLPKLEDRYLKNKQTKYNVYKLLFSQPFCLCVKV